MPKGAVVGYEQFIGTTGKTYKVPLLADGKGGATRWMADVIWADLPLQMRMRFTMGGGGLLDIKDIEEIARTYGDKSTLALFPEKE